MSQCDAHIAAVDGLIDK